MSIWISLSQIHPKKIFTYTTATILFECCIRNRRPISPTHSLLVISIVTIVHLDFGFTDPPKNTFYIHHSRNSFRLLYPQQASISSIHSLLFFSILTIVHLSFGIGSQRESKGVCMSPGACLQSPLLLSVATHKATQFNPSMKFVIMLPLLLWVTYGMSSCRQTRESSRLLDIFLYRSLIV